MSLYTERYVPEVVDKLRNINHETLVKILNILPNNSNKGEEVKTQTLLMAIRKLTREARKNNYRRDVGYKFAKGKTEGRLFADCPSLQNVSRLIRGALCHEFAIDFDMKNAHPCILYDICRRNAINCDYLNDYIRYRDEKLMDMVNDDDINRDEAKTFFIKSLNDEKRITKRGKYKIKNNFFLEYDKQIKKIQQEIMKLYPDIYEHNKRYHSYNPIGKTMSAVMCIQEGRLLEKAVALLEGEGFRVMTLAFDGLMLHKYNEQNIPIPQNAVLEKLNELTKDDNIKWDIKDHDLGALDAIMDLKGGDDDVCVVYGDTEQEVVKQINSFFFQGKFFASKGRLFYKCGNTWITDRRHITHDIRKKIDQSYGYLVRQDKDGNETFENITHSLTKSKQIINQLLEMAVENEDFVSELEQRCLGKLTFENGYYDFNKQRFLPHTPDYETICSISHDFEYVNPFNASRIELMERVIYPMFCVGDTPTTPKENTDNYAIMEDFLYHQARAMAGIMDDKIWFMITGERDSCKSCYNMLLQKAFGNYIQTFNTCQFELDRNKNDVNLKQGFLLNMTHSRICISQEISDSWLDGVLIKKVSSGGDEMTGRNLYQNTTTFKFVPKIMFFGNTEAQIRPQDAFERCWSYRMVVNSLMTLTMLRTLHDSLSIIKRQMTSRRSFSGKILLTRSLRFFLTITKGTIHSILRPSRRHTTSRQK